jgi:hypothetical protein
MFSEFFDFQALNRQDHIDRYGTLAFGDNYIDGALHRRDYVFAVFIDDTDHNLVLALLDVAEPYSEGDGALRMDGGELFDTEGIEGSEHVDFSEIIRGGIA